MSTPPAPARVFGYVAAEADVCVLLRRGPSKQVLMVRWDLATDEFEIGQWLKAQVYEDACDLSPDGRLFAYQANDGRYWHEHGGVYTVVCRPPYFTALAFWAQGSRHSQGLRWSEPSVFDWATDRPDEPTKGVMPAWFRQRLKVHDFDRWVSSRGWSTLGSGRWKDSVAGRLTWHFGPRVGSLGYSLSGVAVNAGWADVDRRGRLLFAHEGKIFVHDADEKREVIDLNPFVFRPLAPPEWATEWPD